MAANGYGQLTSLAAAKTFGLAQEGITVDVTVPRDASHVQLQAETQNVRYRLDGTAPTASVGMLLIAGDAPIQIPVKGSHGLKVIEVAASAKLNYHFTGG